MAGAAGSTETRMNRSSMERWSLCVAVPAIVSAGVSFAQPVVAQEETDQRLGTVHFQTSCNDVAQRRFDRAMRYQHSFWYRQAGEIFQGAAKATAEFGIAYWDLAMTLLNNPHNPPPASNLPLGLAAIQKAQAVGAKTQREREYIDALSRMYVDYDKIDHRTRVQSYLKAMEALAALYPADDEAQIAYAITLNVGASPSDKTYANQLKGAAILEPIFKRLPQHPGVAHYLIHLYDYPPIAEKGLDAAMRYSKIAPAAPHAQHMPSHIFTRVGYWKESIASNIASVSAAKADKQGDDQLHGMDYMVYAYLQLGQDSKAKAVVEEAQEAKFNPESLGGPFGFAAAPARYAVERGDWTGAANLKVPTSKFAHVQAITHFARALGAARCGNPDAAKAEVAKLAELTDKLREAKDAYWASIVDIQRQIASAWLLYAGGRHDEALSAMAAAADTEDKTDKHPVTPGPLAPARELYGAMLLDRGMAKEALGAYEAVFTKEPNRLATYVGAANAATKLGKAEKAKQYTAKVMSLTRDADSQRPDVMDLRTSKSAAAH